MESKRQQNQKLKFRKDTLRVLTPDQLKPVVGGTGTDECGSTQGPHFTLTCYWTQ